MTRHEAPHDGQPKRYRSVSELKKDLFPDLAGMERDRSGGVPTRVLDAVLRDGASHGPSEGSRLSRADTFADTLPSS